MPLIIASGNFDELYSLYADNAAMQILTYLSSWSETVRCVCTKYIAVSE